MKIYCPITVDLYDPYPQAIIKAKQNDVGRGALITLTAGCDIIDPIGESIQIYIKKRWNKSIRIMYRRKWENQSRFYKSNASCTR